MAEPSRTRQVTTGPIAYRTTGEGPPVLLIHGGAEDAGMLTGQAEAIAGHGRQVLWYDRRGTGASTREGWPEGGVETHADDAAALLRSAGAVPATVLGFSSGGVVALALAARHPDVVDEVIAWEPAALGVLPDGAALHAQLLAPIEGYLAAHPTDWTGAYAVMLEVLSEGRADLGSPAVRRQMVNAEPAVRDDARIITRHVFAVGSLPAGKVTVAVGRGTDPLHAAVADRLRADLGRPAAVVDEADDHEVYLHRPAVLADWLARHQAGSRRDGVRPAGCRIVRGGSTYDGKQGLTYDAGISAETAGARQLCLHTLVIPPGARGQAHLHEAHESAIYVVAGEGDLWSGQRLSQHDVVRAGDFVHIPPGVPHLPGNRSAVDPLLAVVARTDPHEQESVVLLPGLTPPASRTPQPAPADAR